MFCIISKPFSSLMPVMRNFTYKLYSNAAKSSDTLSKGSNTKKKPHATKQNNKWLSKGKKSKTTVSGGKCQSSATGGGKNQHPSKKDESSSYIHDKCDIFELPKGNSKCFRLISYCLLPLIGGLSGYVLTQHDDRERTFVPYEYMYRRLKRFAWGDGKTTFFHGPNNFRPEKEQYEPKPKNWADDIEIKKALRDQHAKDEMVRRKSRQAQKKSSNKN